jgi:hypothetical protein
VRVAWRGGIVCLPHKAFNVRRNPRVSLLFSNPAASGLTVP